MHDKHVTEWQAVVVRDKSGKILHTHEVLYFDHATPVDESTLYREAMQAALALHKTAIESDLEVATSSRDELDKMRRGCSPRSANATAGGKIGSVG
jgi:hypothetical protein